jgi:ribosomal protein S18 acetylase RimI-like enzyme
VSEVSIRRLGAANAGDLNRCDNAFTVEAELRVTAEGREIGYAIEPVAPYLKQFGPEQYDPLPYAHEADHAAWLAYVDGEVAGQILVKENWNRYAIIWDLAVSPPFRRMGIGRRLMREAVAWARERGLPGVMLETQHINVAACRLYAECGFRLRGFDTHLYRATLPETEEIALFWYLVF